MIELNHQFLVELGLGHLNAREQETINRRIYEVLELRVGSALVNSLTKSEQDIFEKALSESSDDAHAYLADVVPNYASVVRSEVEAIATAIVLGMREEAATDQGSGSEGGRK